MLAAILLPIIFLFNPDNNPSQETNPFTARQWLIFTAIAAPALLWALS